MAIDPGFAQRLARLNARTARLNTEYLKLKGLAKGGGAERA